MEGKKVKRFLSFLMILGLTLGVLIGCRSNSSTEDNEQKTESKTTEIVDESDDTTEGSDAVSFPLTVTDAIGNEVTIQNKPEKIVSLIPSNTEILFSLNLGDKIVGVTE